VSKDLICPNMKKITLRKLARALETEKEEIRVPADIAGRAVDAIQRMLDLPE
jgi:quinolinate synthase